MESTPALSQDGPPFGPGKANRLYVSLNMKSWLLELHDGFAKSAVPFGEDRLPQDGIRKGVSRAISPAILAFEVKL